MKLSHVIIVILMLLGIGSGIRYYRRTAVAPSGQMKIGSVALQEILSVNRTEDEHQITYTANYRSAKEEGELYCWKKKTGLLAGQIGCTERGVLRLPGDIARYERTIPDSAFDKLEQLYHQRNK